jgi:hypothetical protein
LKDNNGSQCRPQHTSIRDDGQTQVYNDFVNSIITYPSQSFFHREGRMNSRWYSKFLAGVISSLVIFSLFSISGFAAKGDTMHVLAADNDVFDSGTGNLVSGDTGRESDVFVDGLQSKTGSAHQVITEAGTANSITEPTCSEIYNGSNGWVVEMCPTDPAVTTTMTVMLNGTSKGDAAFVRIYHQSENGPGVPQVAIIYASGYVRLKQNADPSPSIPFGTSFVLGPAYWPSSSTYYHNPQLNTLEIDTSWLPNAPLRMRAEGTNHDFDVTYEMTLPPPRDRQTRLHVTQTYTATADITIDQDHRDDYEGFKLVQASSMFINEGGTCDGGYTDCHDSDAARFIGDDLERHEVPFTGLTLPSFVFDSPVPLGSTWLDILHTDDEGWQGNTPNTRIALDELPTEHTITPQGRIAKTTDPNQDNVGLWLHDDGPASSSWTTGDSNTIGYWLLAQNNKPEPWADLDLRSGLTFLDFEGSYDCSTGASAGATANTTLIEGYSDKALQLNYNLGSADGNWAQIICHFASPLDLSVYDHLRIDWRGDPVAANSLQVGLVDNEGHNFFDRVMYRHVTQHAWWGQLVVPFSLFESSPIGTPFDPAHVSAIFISVVKSAADGGAGGIAIDNLSAFNVASRTVPGDFEAVDPDNPVAAQAAADWLAAQQQPNGLLKSWEEDGTCLSYTYDQALALIVFADQGMWSNADALVDRLVATQETDGSWFQGRSCTDLSVLPGSTKWEGDIAWAVYALGRYRALGGTHPKAAATLQKGADWLATRINPADGCLVINSTEATIDTWWAFQADGASHTSDADNIKLCLMTYYWNDTMGRFNGGRDQWQLPYLDNQTWGAAFLKAIGETEKARRALSYARDVLRVPAQGGQLFGFDGNAGPWSVWNEGTAQYVAVGGEGANDLLQEPLAQQREDGAMPGSPDEFNGGGVWTTRWHGVAPTAWLYFALSGEPFVPALLAPADGTHLFHPTPTLDWGDGQDHYQVQIATANDFNAASIVRDENFAVSTYTPAQALPDGVYYWRVKAFNAAGESKGWLLGAPSSFTIETLRDISYYPKGYAWQEMWNHWPDAKIEMDQDLDRITALGFNTVRIFLHPDAIGYPTPDPTQLVNFEEALALIDAHGLKAHVNLFDCWGQWDEVDKSKTWLMAIVAPHRDDPRIALWELKNEVIFDLSKPEYQMTRDWVQALFPLLKAQVGNTPVTVSVYDVEWLDDVKDLTGATPPDIYSLHWYPDNLYSWTDAFPAKIDRARQLIGQADLLIGEFGLSTYAYSDALQADLTRDVLYYADQKGITNLGFWTLNDFPANTLICCVIPKDEQWYYGLYRTDGTQKPAASILQAAFQGNPPSSPSPRRILNPSFEDLSPYSGYLDNWWPWDGNWTGQHWEVQNCTIAHSGSCSAKLHGSSGVDVGLHKSPPALIIDPEQHYSLEGWVRTENLGGPACIAFSWFDDQNDWIDGEDATSCVTDPNLTEWTRITINNATPPPDAIYAEVFVKMFSNNSDSHVWFDDVNLIPRVVSITRADPNPTNAASVHFTVTFSDPVTGVDSGDFSLTTTSSIAGATITDVSGGPTIYTVTVNTGVGDGTIRLDIPETTNITDLAGNPLGSLPYTSGEMYTIDKSLTFTSTGTRDGWVLESTEISGVGGSINSNATTLRLGDDAAKKQYRSILSFSTKGLPDSAVITKVTLKVRKQSITGGGNPITTFQGFMVDIRKGYFGMTALQTSDFQATAHKSPGPFKPALSSGWYNIDLTSGKSYINKSSSYGGVTQIRLRFKLDDNNNTIANYLSLYSGNASSSYRPQLIIEYYVP